MSPEIAQGVLQPERADARPSPGETQTDLEYWRVKLAGVEPLELPADHPRPASPSEHGGRCSFALTDIAAARLRELGRIHDASLFMVLLTGLTAFLVRYSGQEDVVVGTIAEPALDDTKDPIGFVSNPLALRTDASGNPTFRTLLSRVKQTCVDAYAHQQVPFDALVETLAPDRDPARPPIFQVMLVVQGSSAGDVRDLEDGSVAHSLARDRSGATFDLVVKVVEASGGLVGTLEYRTDLFDAETASRMGRHLTTLLAGAAADPSLTLRALPLLSNADEDALLTEWGANAVDHSAASDFLRMFEERAATDPDRAAAIFGNDSLTYNELDVRANRLARRLQMLDVGPDVVVAVALERSLEMIVAVLGVLKTGGAYAPIDPAYPPDRVSFMLEDTQAPVLLTLARLKDRFSVREGVRVIGLDDDWAREVAAMDPAGPLRMCGPDDLAYVIYTSGSTGRPKGVAMRRGPLSNLIRWQRQQWPDDARTVLQFASLSFDVSFQEIFSTFAVGGCLVLISEEVRLDPVALVEAVAEHAIETLFLPPVMLHEFVRAARARAKNGGSPIVLRQIITAGELLNVDRDVSSWLATQPDCQLHNHYGPTEAHVVTAYTLPAGFMGPVPIGRPIHNARIYIVDHQGVLVPPNVPGELLIGGACLARGYFNRVDLTAERFVPDPFDPTPGARVYRTGDLARWRADGVIEFLGRIDRQIKIRGFRIEPAAIEAVLEEHPGVRQAVVCAPQWGEHGEKRLVAYVVLADATLSFGSDLRPYLKAKLPSYMVPAAIVPLDALPLTPNQKVDWAALPAPDWHRAGQGDLFLAPRTETERRLVAVWKTVLGLDNVGVTSNFFDLGSSSIDGAHLLAAIESEFHVRLPFGVLFRAPTIEQLATFLERPVATSDWTSLVPIQSRGTKRPFFCVHGGAGTIYLFDSLSRRLADDQPLYAFQSQGLYGGNAPHNTVEQMAAHYVHEMRTVQKTGPYSIGGYCFGGVVAYEMARQLRQKGHDVKLLALFNAPNYLYYAAQGGIQGIFIEPRQPLEPVSAGRLKRFYWQLWWLARQIRTGAAGRKSRWRLVRALGIPVPASVRGYFFLLNHLKAEREYVLPPYDGRMLLFRAERLERDPSLGWSGLVAGGIECHAVGSNGREREILQEPWVQSVAEILTQHLNAGEA